jgi:hypothetical protein
MRARLVSISSTDVDDLENWSPGPDFGVAIMFLAGPGDGAGEDNFQIMVCSPSWLAREIERDGIMTGRHMIIMHEYSFRTLRAFIEKNVQTVEGQSWNEVGEKLSRFGLWEFEDYRPYDPGKSRKGWHGLTWVGLTWIGLGAGRLTRWMRSG